jgi:hypothetical protein
MAITDTILNTFKLPIEYTDFKYLNKNVISDLELDTSNNAYSFLFDCSGTNQTHTQRQNNLGKLIQKKWKHYYSSNSNFLKTQQKFIKSISKTSKTDMEEIKGSIQNINTYFEKWKNIKNMDNEAFIKKYQFIDWQHIQFLNKHPIFLQAMCYYNIASPLMYILMPIILLIVPFFLIKLVLRIPFTFEKYKSLLGKSFQSHAFGKIFNAFCAPNCETLDMNTKIYAAVSFAIYIFTLYQNIIGCIKFYYNARFIKEFMYETKHFIKHCNKLHQFLGVHNKNKLEKFKNTYDDEAIQLNNFSTQIKNTNSTFFSVTDIPNVGLLMYNFHEIFDNTDNVHSFCYWFGCCGFLENICNFVERNNKLNINFAKISSKNTALQMNNLFYIYHSKNNVKNSVKLDKNYIVSGPNASGKTTLLKSLLLNIVLTQQVGAGCYSSCLIKPFDYLDSYINIPDTSERDSLFQAEARRCLNIIQFVKRNPDQSVFCIFDELFSGTNPYEAQKSAIAYLNYLHKHNVSYLLTTHFNKLKDFETPKSKQFNMDVLDSGYENNFKYTYTYKLQPGKSIIYGGFKVLSDLKYPTEILEEISN